MLRRRRAARDLAERARGWLASKIPARPARSGGELASAFGLAFVVILLWDVLTGWLAAPWQVAFGAAIVICACVVLRKRDLHQLAIGAFAAVVAVKSVPVIENLAGSHQAMNRNYDRLELVNTYGAFGSVGMTRHELVIEGTLDADPATATWHAYELPCEPGDVARRPCVLGPYHRRLDWLMWFAAMADRAAAICGSITSRGSCSTAIARSASCSRSIRFDGEPPRWIRIRSVRLPASRRPIRPTGGCAATSSRGCRRSRRTRPSCARCSTNTAGRARAPADTLGSPEDREP